MVAVAALTGLGRVLISPVERRVAAARMFLAELAAKSASIFGRLVKSYRASVKPFIFFPWIYLFTACFID